MITTKQDYDKIYIEFLVYPTVLFVIIVMHIFAIFVFENYISEENYIVASLKVFFKSIL